MENTLLLQDILLVPPSSSTATSFCFLTCPFRILWQPTGSMPMSLPKRLSPHHCPKVVNPDVCVPLLVTDSKLVTVKPRPQGLVQNHKIRCYLAVHASNDNALGDVTRRLALIESPRRDGETAQWLRAWVALIEDPGLVPSTHMVAQNYLQLQFQGI